ncbi:hypothetical protein AMECASPLE_027365 [Ameca splendens]|uniref:Uncharacterized protein n=1 Tax=Ameca splendens TaxID=208324 RepID=A0ABV0Y549_9TELE
MTVHGPQGCDTGALEGLGGVWVETERDTKIAFLHYRVPCKNQSYSLPRIPVRSNDANICPPLPHKNEKHLVGRENANLSAAFYSTRTTVTTAEKTAFGSLLECHLQPYFTCMSSFLTTTTCFSANPPAHPDISQYRIRVGFV